MDNPWLHGAVAATTRQERRSSRIRPPAPVVGAYIYNSDGVCRRGNDERRASTGVVLHDNGRLISQYGRYLGDCSNNEAEYAALLQALAHAGRQPGAIIIIFRVDSMLLSKHMNGEWACRSNNLVPMYIQGLELLRTLRGRGVDVKVQHV